MHACGSSTFLNPEGSHGHCISKARKTTEGSCKLPPDKTALWTIETPRKGYSHPPQRLCLWQKHSTKGAIWIPEGALDQPSAATSRGHDKPWIQHPQINWNRLLGRGQSI
ncbi:hypothetical protein FKM82_027292 [Ascaphus truei]